jgi:hypothetical protein
MRRSNNFANRNATLQPITPRSNHVTPDTLARPFFLIFASGGGESEEGGRATTVANGRLAWAAAGGGTAAVADGGLVPVMLAEPDNEG